MEYQIRKARWDDLPRIEELTFAQESTEAIEDPATPEEDFETPVIDEIFEHISVQPQAQKSRRQGAAKEDHTVS